MIGKIIEKGLNSLLEERLQVLGERSKYIGASDVGLCPRMVVLRKKNKPEFTLKEKLRLVRGYLTEKLLEDLLIRAGIKFRREVEFSLNGGSIRSHIDFLFESKSQNKVGVIECKSTGNLPDEPYPHWVSQVYFQLGIINENTLSDIQPKGAIIAFDLNRGEYKFYNGYEYSSEFFSTLLRRAELILHHLKEDTLPDPEPGDSCGFCQFLGKCPAFEGGVEVPFEDEIELIYGLRKQIKALKEEEENLVEEIKDFFAPLEEKEGVAGDYFVRLKEVEQRRVDTRRLKEEKPEVYEEYSYKKKSYSLVIKKKKKGGD